MHKTFPLDEAFRRIETALASYPKAAMFELAARGYTTLFEQLISCIVSIRTLDETTLPVSERLFANARTPEALLRLSADDIATLLHGATYPEQKAQTMLGVARAAVEQHGGTLPANYDQLTALKGVGPKCANLALGVATGQAAISVDIHVHRVMNRWGVAQTRQPEQTLRILEQNIPQTQWIDVNRLLMPFGKFICTGQAPKCSTCPVLDLCPQIGVTTHR